MAAHRLRKNLLDDRRNHRGSLIPYFTAGFPDDRLVARLVRRADELGAAAVEIGFPFSDSIADGPVIQAAHHQALQHGQTVEATMTLAAHLRTSIRAALVAMLSYSIVYRIGPDRFADRAAAAGFDGVIVADLPDHEAGEWTRILADRSLAHIPLVAPTTGQKRLAAIAASATGFVYVVAAEGATGERSAFHQNLPALIQATKAAASVPVCVGFGISTPTHLQQVCAIADGAIVGSAITRRIDDSLRRGDSIDQTEHSVAAFLQNLITAASRNPSDRT